MAFSVLVPILKDTWGNSAGDSICYYSEMEDTVAGTTSLGIPNTETGIVISIFLYYQRWQKAKVSWGPAWNNIACNDKNLHY